MNNISQLKSEKCFGCASCVNKCCNSSITMVNNNEGFLYPAIDNEKCIKCGACVVSCPAIGYLKKKNKPVESYIAICTNFAMAAKSSSGGVFSSLAHSYISEGDSAVYGCALGENLVAHHERVVSAEGIKKLQGSKYVQGSIGSAYRQVKKDLGNGLRVVFSGTPCQIEGLNQFLGQKEYDNLLTIDLICHGVSSPELFARQLKYYEKKYSSRVTNITFRHKNRYERTSFSFTIMTEDGKTRIVQSYKDLYYYLFLSGFTFRESCYQCPYACEERVGDITIGDCASRNNYSSFHPDKAVSSVLINTGKGMLAWKRLRDLEYRIIDYDNEAMKNEQLNKPFKRDPIRDTIYLELLSSDTDEANKKYLPKETLSQKAKQLIKRIVPVKTRENIRSIVISKVK